MESRERVYIAVRTIVISGTLPRCVGNQETHAARHPTYHLPLTNERASSRKHLQVTCRSAHGCLASCTHFRFRIDR
jgi:hypothetical protein